MSVKRPALSLAHWGGAAGKSALMMQSHAGAEAHAWGIGLQTACGFQLGDPIVRRQYVVVLLQMLHGAIGDLHADATTTVPKSARARQDATMRERRREGAMAPWYCTWPPVVELSMFLRRSGRRLPTPRSERFPREVLEEALP